MVGTTGKPGAAKRPAARPAPKRSPSKPRTSAKVYRRRRLVVVILALLIIGGLVTAGVSLAGMLGAGPAAKTATGQNTNGVAENPKPAAKPGTKPSAVCDEGGIKVAAAVDKTAYTGEEHPVLTLRVTNTGAAPCDINVGTSQMEYVITSGDDIIFNSKNCALDPNDLVKNLAPGASETANLVWSLNRNAPDCAPVVSQPGRGGATYMLVATLGKWSSERVSFTLQ